MGKYKGILFIDFETRSEADLKSVGSHKYLTDPSTEMILVSYAFDKASAQVCEEMPREVEEAIESRDFLKIAHNAEFDMCVCKYLLKLDINPYDWHDTAYQASYYGFPRSLHNLTEYLGTTKKASQEELVLFSIPVEKASKPSEDDLFFVGSEAVWNTKETHPQEWEAFKHYALLDTEVMREAYGRMAELPSIETFCMQVTFEMNINGVPVDTRFAKRIYDMSQEYSRNAGEKALEKYGIENLRSTQQVQKALLKEGIYLKSLNAKTRLDVEHEILELRDQATGAAFSKIPKMFERVMCDGRLRGEFVGHGAHTGRWTSRGVQLQNLSRILTEASDDLSKVRDCSHLREHMRLIIGNLYGYDFTCADLSQIEARIVAWLAGCRWRQNAFENHEDIYARSAERMFGIPHVSKHDKERQYGKCAELGLGYGGGVAAIERVNPDFYHEVGEAKVAEIVSAWRSANPEICALWRTLDKAFREALKTGGCKFYLNKVRISIQFDGKTARITLPSGRALYYRDCHLVASPNGSDMVYMDYSRGGDNCGTRTKFWGGTLLENITQAIARDVLVDIMWRVKRNYPHMQAIGTVHDEVWYLTAVNPSLNKPMDAPLTLLLQEMKNPIQWAEGLVTEGDGFTDKRYIK